MVRLSMMPRDCDETFCGAESELISRLVKHIYYLVKNFFNIYDS